MVSFRRILSTPPQEIIRKQCLTQDYCACMYYSTNTFLKYIKMCQLPMPPPPFTAPGT